MNMISQFIDNGIDPEQILNQLIKNTPKIASKVKAALANGYLPDQILGFLQEEKKRKTPLKERSSAVTPFADPSEKIAHEMLYKSQFKPESAQDKAYKRLESILGNVGKFGLETAGGLALGGLAGTALKTASPVIKSILGSAKQASPLLQRLMGAMSVGENLMQGRAGLNEGQHPINPQMDAQINQQPPQPEQQVPDSKSILDQIGITPLVDNLLQAGNGPEQIEAAIGIQLQPNKKKWIQQNFPQGLQPVIQDYISKAGMQQENQQIIPKVEEQKPQRSITEIINGANDLYEKWRQEKERNPSFKLNFENILKTNLGLSNEEAQLIASNIKGSKELHKPIDKSDEIKQEPEETVPIPQKPGKDTVTNLPDGSIGEIKSLNSKYAMVESDGKLRQIELSELKTPEMVKKAKIIFDPENIPENEKSAALGMFLVAPSKTSVTVSYGPSEGFYEYRRIDGKPIPEDQLNAILEGTEVPISSGDTYMGAWNSKNADSRGSANFRYIQDLSIPDPNFPGVEKKKERDANKPPPEYYVTKLDQKYIHPYIKEFLNLLKGASTQYVKSKKPPKPTKPKK